MGEVKSVSERQCLRLAKKPRVRKIERLKCREALFAANKKYFASLYIILHLFWIFNIY